MNALPTLSPAAPQLARTPGTGAATGDRTASGDAFDEVLSSHRPEREVTVTRSRDHRRDDAADDAREDAIKQADRQDALREAAQQDAALQNLAAALSAADVTAQQGLGAAPMPASAVLGTAQVPGVQSVSAAVLASLAARRAQETAEPATPGAAFGLTGTSTVIDLASGATGFDVVTGRAPMIGPDGAIGWTTGGPAQSPTPEGSAPAGVAEPELSGQAAPGQAVPAESEPIAPVSDQPEPIGSGPVGSQQTGSQQGPVPASGMLDPTAPGRSASASTGSDLTVSALADLPDVTDLTIARATAPEPEPPAATPISPAIGQSDPLRPAQPQPAEDPLAALPATSTGTTPPATSPAAGPLVVLPGTAWNSPLQPAATQVIPPPAAPVETLPPAEAPAASRDQRTAAGGVQTLSPAAAVAAELNPALGLMTPAQPAGAALRDPRTAKGAEVPELPMPGLGTAPASPATPTVAQPDPAAAAAPAASSPQPLINQVLDHLTKQQLLSARNLRDGSHRAVFRLSPDNLGSVTVTLDVRSGQVRLDLAAGAQALTTLGSDLGQLRSQLADAGLNLADVTLSAQTPSGSSGSFGGQSAPHRTPQPAPATASHHVQPATELMPIGVRPWSNGGGQRPVAAGSLDIVV
jgi:flagellar hook-length control protein FliK